MEYFLAMGVYDGPEGKYEGRQEDPKIESGDRGIKRQPEGRKTSHDNPLDDEFNTPDDQHGQQRIFEPFYADFDSPYRCGYSPGCKNKKGDQYIKK